MSPIRPLVARSAAVIPLVAALSIFAACVPMGPDTTFDHIATFDVIAENGSGVAEIIDATDDGNQLVYTDADNNQIGFVDIVDPENPIGTGTVDLPGEPTSLVVRGDYVMVGANTSPSFVDPSGKLVVVSIGDRAIVGEYELAGQPDSLALSPDEKFLAIVIENERDEDLDDGLLPQLPTGGLQIVDFRNETNPTLSDADLSPVIAAAPGDGDLEPEYVDINEENQAVVTFQENNYLAIVNLWDGTVVSHFTAGEAELSNVDTVEEDLINLDSNITKRREPDAVTWINKSFFATANEGDYEDANGEEGGSRGFTIFNKQGRVVFESAESFEHLLVSAGHYNEGRSENKGVEPESVEFGTYGSRDLLFVGSERSNAVGVYDVTTTGEPSLVQVMPTGIGPEGIKALPKRGLVIVSTEADEADDGIPTMINIYQLANQDADYPMIVSANDDNGTPIPWVALSGLAADPTDADTLYAVNDSFLASGFIYTIDVSQTPALITDRLLVADGAEGLDLEGIAVGPDGSFWLGSEGQSPDDGTERQNLVLNVDATTGAAISEIQLPTDLIDMRRGNGIEGIAVTGETGSELVYVAIQRAWPDEGDVDQVETKIGRYDVATKTWGFVHYPLEAEGNGGWVGLSELTALADGSFAVIERDKGWGPTTGPVAELKAVFQIELEDAHFRAFDDPDGLVTITKSPLIDVLPLIEENSIWTAEKLEGFAVAADGQAYAVTDNDGVDDAPGETVFLRLGDLDD